MPKLPNIPISGTPNCLDNKKEPNRKQAKSFFSKNQIRPNLLDEWLNEKEKVRERVGKRLAIKIRILPHTPGARHAVFSKPKDSSAKLPRLK